MFKFYQFSYKMSYRKRSCFFVLCRCDWFA